MKKKQLTGSDAHLDEKKVAEIKRRLKAGEGPVAIAKDIGCTPGAVSYHKRQLAKKAGAAVTAAPAVDVLTAAARGLAAKARRTWGGVSHPVVGDEFYAWVARGYVEGWFTRLEQAIAARRGRK
jgi:hypothetical protein